MERPVPDFPALGDLLVETHDRGQLIDEPVERLLAMVVALARVDAEQVRRMLRPEARGLREVAPALADWAKGLLRELPWDGRTTTCRCSEPTVAPRTLCWVASVRG